MIRSLVKMTVVLGTLIATSQAFAMHAYRSEDCRSGKFILRYEGNYPVGGYDSLALRSHSDEKLSLINASQVGTVDAIYSPDEAKVMDLLYTQGPMKNLRQKPDEIDGCFVHGESKYGKTVTFQNVGAKAAALGLSEGQVMEFKCKATTDYPVEWACNQ